MYIFLKQTTLVTAYRNQFLDQFLEMVGALYFKRILETAPYLEIKTFLEATENTNFL